ncbi:MAG: SusC/RagA family TonB-linked outer membrane protein [Marinilabiliaceae bacterium]|nr:SusC/RagA family TonB-linked outer membrane protein [Marinilabiliaceae bacterium]
MLWRVIMLSSCFLFMNAMYVTGQGIQVSGTVKDGTTSEPIPGVNVYIDGTQTGVITDFDGKFSLDVPNSNSVLVFSFIGYKIQKVNVGGQKTINVALLSDVTALDEVVAIGYGTAKRKDVMGSVASVSADQLTIAPVSSAVEALTGKMAGVQITSTEGSPDAEIKIRVRGGGSITQDNSPLFIVDGFPVESISDIPSSDIQSIDVLKDASSTAIYGSRGANGVVIVTTKSGVEGKMSVSYNAFYGVKKIAKTLDVLDAEDYVMWQYELAALRDEVEDKYEPYFGTYQDIDLYEGLEGNDWQDQVFGRTGTSFNHNLSLTGGSEKTKYSFSYAHMEDKAIMLGSDFERDNLSLKLNNKPHKRINLDFSVRYSNTKINGGGANAFEDKGSTSESRLKHAVLYSPIPLEGVTSDFDEEESSSDLINPFTVILTNVKFKS